MYCCTGRGYCCTGRGINPISIPNPRGPIMNCAAAGIPSQGAATIKIKPANGTGNPERRWMRWKPYCAGMACPRRCRVFENA